MITLSDEELYGKPGMQKDDLGKHMPRSTAVAEAKMPEAPKRGREF